METWGENPGYTLAHRTSMHGYSVLAGRSYKHACVHGVEYARMDMHSMPESAGRPYAWHEVHAYVIAC